MSGVYTRSDYVGSGITSPPWDNTHGSMTLGMACHHRLWEAHTVERRRVWHAIIALGRRDMPSPPLHNTHGRTTLGVALHHRPWTARTVERRRAWHSIIAFGQNTQSNDVARGMTSPPMDSTLGRTTWGHTQSKDIGHVMTSPPLDCTNSRTTSGAWHDITTLGMHARSDDVGHGMTSPPLDSTRGRQRRAWHDITSLGQHTRLAMSGVACITALGLHKQSDDVGRGIISPPLDSTQGRTMLGVARHHRLWTAHTIGRRRA
uniref:Uncharacterized protein n=1 Tax=Solanum lycopersicum TaxID=4081 RepID=A0A494G8X7_SOLLC